MRREFHVRFWERVELRCSAPHNYLHEYDTVAEAKAGIAAYLDWYNRDRPHSSLKTLPHLPCRPRIPDEAYRATLLPSQQAA